MEKSEKQNLCTVCGEPMPEGETMFKFHGYSGPCPKPPLPRPATLEQILRTTYPVGPGCVGQEGSPASPDFRVAIQAITDEGVHFIIHANGHDSETGDFIIKGNTLRRL